MLAVLSLFGCSDDDDTPGTGGSSGTGSASSSTTGATSSGSTNSASTSASGGTTAMSSSATGAGVCTPGAEEPCYNGPADTLGVGTCIAGIATCNDRGTALGPCVGEVLPAAEPCGSSADENCDGVILPCANP